MKTLREMMDLVEAAQTSFYKGYDDAYYDSKDSNPYETGSTEYDDYVRGNTAGLADVTDKSSEGTNEISVGDTVTWWYNKYHPDYEGIVRDVRGNTIIVYAPGSGDMFKLTKDDIRSHQKSNRSNDEEQDVDEAATPEAITKVEQLASK